MVDFSGEWVLNRAASTLSPGADAMQSAVMQIVHGDPAFRCKATFTPAEGKPFEFEYELTTDGREVSGTDNGRALTSSMRWDGDALAATWQTQGPDMVVTIAFRYELLDDGRLLRAAEQVRGTDHDQDNVWMFERR